jgi:hypothetical protein
MINLAAMAVLHITYKYNRETVKSRLRRFLQGHYNLRIGQAIAVELDDQNKRAPSIERALSFDHRRLS